MATLQEQIAEKFLKKLAEDETLDANKIEQLRKVLQSDRKLKPDDFVGVFKLPTGGELQ